MNVVRRIAVPFVSLGILAGASMACAGMADASAAGLGGTDPVGSGNLFSPNTYAQPAPVVGPGWNRYYHGSPIIVDVGGDD